MLKAVLASKAEHDALPEAMRKEYKESDGKYTLDVEGGLVPAGEVLEIKTKLAEFRDNNRTMHGELERLRPLATKFEGVDPDEYRELKEEMGKLRSKGVKGIDDIQAAINKAVADAVKPVADKLAEEAKARETAQKQADDGKFRELVSAAATTAGVSSTAIRHVLREAAQVFELKDGKLSPKEGVKHPTDPLKDMNTTDWLQQLSKTDDYLFAGSNGAGAPGAPAGGTKPGVKKLINPSPEEMGQHMDALSKGEMVVERR